MSDMVQKLEQEKSNGVGGALCNLSWFIPNLGSRMTITESDSNGPTKLSIDRPIEKRTEIWHRVSFDKKDSTFELKASYPTEEKSNE